MNKETRKWLNLRFVLRIYWSFSSILFCNQYPLERTQAEQGRWVAMKNWFCFFAKSHLPKDFPLRSRWNILQSLVVFHWKSAQKWLKDLIFQSFSKVQRIIGRLHRYCCPNNPIAYHSDYTTRIPCVQRGGPKGRPLVPSTGCKVRVSVSSCRWALRARHLHTSA